MVRICAAVVRDLRERGLIQIRLITTITLYEKVQEACIDCMPMYGRYCLLSVCTVACDYVPSEHSMQSNPLHLNLGVRRAAAFLGLF